MGLLNARGVSGEMILVTGATGFLGGHLVRKLMEKKVEVRILARPTSKVSLLKEAGVSSCEGNITDVRSLEKAAEGVDAVVHLVGIIQERAGSTFEAIHSHGTRNLVEACVERGAKRFIYVSALGTGPKAFTRYHLTKWDAEEAVRKSGMEYTILRPSVIFGRGDGFTNGLAALIRRSPVIPVIGDGRYKLQPISVRTVVSALVQSLESDRALNKVLEMGGPQQLEFTEILDIIADAIGLKKLKVRLPSIPVRLLVRFMEKVMANPPVTVDQINMLLQENICDNTLMNKTFDLEAIYFEDGIKEYL